VRQLPAGEIEHQAEQARAGRAADEADDRGEREGRVPLALVRLGLRPDINALATIIILTVAIGVILAAWIMLRQQKQRERDMQMAAAENLKSQA